ncbi:SGNH/GDSL hydrolase family protein [Sporichthya polymorpha]|uniref:SGNH/GDSL hydrolase family protein n=1 Tax=Sporichthya polymorpha TaxID=35751 RepID=UPI000686DBB8|nr:GDSL-type esterase/lipase family protein [Sporichthya polymorpha]
MTARSAKPRSLVVATVTALLAVLAPPAVAAAVPEMPAPQRVTAAALGDSITRGFNACGFYRDCPKRSWSTGGDSSVRSHAQRLQDATGVRIRAVNLARSGARAAALADQAAQAVEAGARYVTVEIGANDVCVASEDRMTPVEEYRASIRAGLEVLRSGAPQARVLVASIPDVGRLWEIGKGRWQVRQVWSRLDVCPSMLAHPTSERREDVERRERVRTRVKQFNAVLEAECAAYGPQCRYDGGAVFRARFQLGQVSKWDFFHPSTSGQRLLAEVSWKAGFFAAEPVRTGGA